MVYSINRLYVYFYKDIIQYIMSHSDFIFVCTRAYNEFAQRTSCLNFAN